MILSGSLLGISSMYHIREERNLTGKPEPLVVGRPSLVHLRCHVRLISYHHQIPSHPILGRRGPSQQRTQQSFL